MLLLGSAASIALTELRPNLRSDVRADYIDAGPERPTGWVGFVVRYRDNYYFGFDVESDVPLTVTVVDADGNAVYTSAEAMRHQESVRLRLERGAYKVLLSGGAGGKLNAELRVE